MQITPLHFFCRWENAVNGTLFGEYFRYVDGVRDLLNADPKKRFRAFYSTPAEYIAAKLGNVTSLPLVVSDFFPYNDDTVGNNENGHNIWAGYFTSRPAFKVRDISECIILPQVLFFPRRWFSLAPNFVFRGL